MPGKRITDHQVHKYKQHRHKLSQVAAAAKAGISERSARRIELQRGIALAAPATELAHPADPLAEVWDSEVVPLLEADAQLNAVTLLEELQRRHPGQYGTGVLRTLQRRMRQWRADARRRARGLLRAGTPAGPAGAVGLHRLRRARRRDRWRRLPAPAVPVRARPLGLAPRRRDSTAARASSRCPPGCRRRCGAWAACPRSTAPTACRPPSTTWPSSRS